MAKNIPVMTQVVGRKIYILPSANKTNFGVAMPFNVAPELIDCIESVFSNQANLMLSTPQPVPVGLPIV